MRGTLWFDGGCRPTNPGVSAFAAIVETWDGDRREVSRPLGWRTNNYAEYTGLVVGLKVAIDMGVTDIEIVTDSQLVEGHLTKGWKRNIDELRVLISEAEKLLTKFQQWEIKWTKRTGNVEADALCSATILAEQMKNPWRKRLAHARTRTRREKKK